MADRNSNPSRYRFDVFTLDLERGALMRDGQELHLRPKSFEVLRYLVQHAGRLVGKQELMDAVWGRTVVTEGSLTQCIVDIRRAIADHDQRILRTIPRRGFIFEGALHASPEPSTAVAAPGAAPPIHSGEFADATTVGPAAATPGRWRPRGLLVGLVALALAGVAATAWLRPGPAVAPRTTPATVHSVAVLRFMDLSPERDQAWFADGLAEELLHLLAQSPDLRVTARASSFAFDPGTTDVARVAEQLDVGHVVEGSVRRDGEALRVTVQLIETRTQTHRWSRTYDRTLSRVLDVQREIAADVAAALAVTLELPEVSASPEADEAQQLYLLGRHLFLRRGPGELAAAEQHFEQAVRLDPRHARAWTALAGVYHVRATGELKDPYYRLEDQRVALERALAIDPTLAEAHVRLGRYYSVRGDTAAAEAAFRRAYEIAPGDSLVMSTLAHDAALDDRFDDAVELARRVVALDPLSAIHRANLGHLLLAAGRHEDALAEAQRAQALSPDDQTIWTDVAVALLLLGRIDEARDAISGAVRTPRIDQLAVLLGDSAAAAAAAARLEAGNSVRTRFLLAEIAAHRGDVDEAYASLEAARGLAVEAGARAGFDLATEIAISPFLRPLVGDPRLAALRRDLPLL